MVDNVFLLNVLDLFITVVHSFVIIFNLFGFFFKKTRLANLICLVITGFSWFILGIWYGFGYCFLVDWHWSIRQKLGFYHDPNSYVKFIVDRITGLNVNEKLVDITTVVLYFLALIASIVLNIRDFKKNA